uniref:PPM-type phosphatase domain-containing protein n=1 Tax=Quercus lobata TaxID=97700 RepID=A0A7N2M895_QUELO
MPHSHTVLGNLTASLSAAELTEDHSPSGDDERARIEVAGGDQDSFLHMDMDFIFLMQGKVGGYASVFEKYHEKRVQMAMKIAAIADGWYQINPSFLAFRNNILSRWYGGFGS